MVFYDFEVFKYDWLVVILDMDNQKEHVIINNSSELEAFYQEHVNDIWVGFNSRGYDQFILKSILCGLNRHTFGAVYGKVKQGDFTFFRISTDDTKGCIKSYLGKGDLTSYACQHDNHVFQR